MEHVAWSMEHGAWSMEHVAWRRQRLAMPRAHAPAPARNACCDFIKSNGSIVTREGHFVKSGTGSIAGAAFSR
ncbi:MAG: hypothetical protein IJU62_00450 [Muribaculaceae bacterium]|nr:hypothetical protein [Muribaculaceae bacterium]